MRRFFTAASLIGLLLFAPAAPAAEPADPVNVTELVRALEGTYKGVQSLKADFVQVQRSSITGEIRQKGTVQLKRPKKARWEFQGGDASTFVTDGKTMWIYTPATKQVIETADVGGAAGGGMTELLDSLEKIDQFFTTTLVAGGDGKGSYVVDLAPKSGGQFKKMSITVSRKKYAVEKVKLVDQMGNETELTFSQLKLNADVTDAAFTFTPPAGVTVIKGM